MKIPIHKTNRLVPESKWVTECDECSVTRAGEVDYSTMTMTILVTDISRERVNIPLKVSDKYIDKRYREYYSTQTIPPITLKGKPKKLGFIENILNRWRHK